MEMPTQKGWLWRLEVGSPTVSVRLLMVLTHHDSHRRGRLTSTMAPDLLERLLAEAKRGFERLEEPVDRGHHALVGVQDQGTGRVVDGARRRIAAELPWVGLVP